MRAQASETVCVVDRCRTDGPDAFRRKKDPRAAATSILRKPDLAAADAGARELNDSAALSAVQVPRGIGAALDSYWQPVSWREGSGGGSCLMGVVVCGTHLQQPVVDCACGAHHQCDDAESRVCRLGLARTRQVVAG